MKTSFNTIVLGCGGVGSGAVYWLARRLGEEVLGLEQFKLGHDHGGSQDHSRIIRRYYHDNHYTALAQGIYTTWQQVQDESGVPLIHITGGVGTTPASGKGREYFEAYAKAMDNAGIAYERFDEIELMKRYPQFVFREPTEVLFQADTGFVDAAKANAAHIALARGYGAAVLDECPVTQIIPGEGEVTLQTPQGTFSCQNLVITAGAWAQGLLAQVGMEVPLYITQEQVIYYATPHLRMFAPDRFPVFVAHEDKTIYGFPVYGEVGTKIALDYSGRFVTPETRTYEAYEPHEQLLEAWLLEHIPQFLGPKQYTKTCLYTMPKDRHFIVDRVPEHPEIIVCNGAGHVMKFASLMGKIVSELAIDGKTNQPIAPFTLDRPAITDAEYPLEFKI